MKLILAIVNNDDAGDVADVLTKENFQITKIATTGGFLKIGNTTLILGVEDQDLDKAINLIGGCA
ncbi:MAG: cyclic-di-AMP receptor, partial [Erysipelotrichaceae bacterium]|nr:cyclic-di-AMP receptor [Erysipelotrichaceae bacterium]